MQNLQKIWHVIKRGYRKLPYKRILALTVMIIITTGAIIPVMAAQKSVKVMIDGQEPRLGMTSRGDVTEDPRLCLKNDFRIVPDEKDSVIASVENDAIVITVRSNLEVTVETDDKSLNHEVFYGDTVQSVLDALSIRLGDHDSVIPSADSVITENTEIVVGRNCKIAVTVDGETKMQVLPKSTLQQALNAMNVELGENDEVSVSLDETISDGMEVSVARVEYQDITTTQAVAYKTVTENDSSMNKGQTKEKTEGVNGERTIVTRQKLVDGAVASAEEISNEITTAPVDRVVLSGTKTMAGYASINTDNGTITDANGNIVRFKSVISGRCTSYTGGGTTSTGLPAAVGRVAVNPKVIPYGSRLYICSPDGRIVYGYAIAADTGGGCMSGLIVSDLYFNTLEECRQFGSRTMSVYVLE